MQSFSVSQYCYFRHQDVKRAQICLNKLLIMYKMFFCFLGDTIMAGRSSSGFLCFFLIKKWKNIHFGSTFIIPSSISTHSLKPKYSNNMFPVPPAVACPCCIFWGYFIKHHLQAFVIFSVTWSFHCITWFFSFLILKLILHLLLYCLLLFLLF